MWRKRLRYTRAAKTRLQALPVGVQMHLETHLENLVLLAREVTPERLAQLLARDEEGFVTLVSGVRVFFAVVPTARSLLIHRIEALPGSGWDSAAQLTQDAEGSKGAG